MLDREIPDHEDNLAYQEILEHVVIEDELDNKDPLDQLHSEVTKAQRNIPVTLELKLQSFAAVLRGKVSLIHVSIATKWANGILVPFQNSLLNTFLFQIFMNFLLVIDGKETEDKFLCDPNQGSPFDSVPCTCDSQLIDVYGKMYTLIWTCFEAPKVSFN